MALTAKRLREILDRIPDDAIVYLDNDGQLPYLAVMSVGRVQISGEPRGVGGKVVAAVLICDDIS